MLIVSLISFFGGSKCNKIGSFRFFNYELKNFFGPMAGFPKHYNIFMGFWCLIGSLLCFSTWYLPEIRKF